MAEPAVRSGTGPKGRLPPTRSTTAPSGSGGCGPRCSGSTTASCRLASPWIVGVAAAGDISETILTVGRRPLSPGRCRCPSENSSLSVSSQRDAERADLPRSGGSGRRPGQRTQRAHRGLRTSGSTQLPAAVAQTAHSPRCVRRPRSRRAGDHRRWRLPARCRRPVRQRRRSPSGPWSRCWRRWSAPRHHASWSSPPQLCWPWPDSGRSAPDSVVPRWAPPPSASPCSGLRAMGDHRGDRGGGRHGGGLMSHVTSTKSECLMLT